MKAKLKGEVSSRTEGITLMGGSKSKKKMMQNREIWGGGYCIIEINSNQYN